MRFFTSVYLLLLAYVIAALVFWGIKLDKQSKQIYDLQVTILKSQIDSSKYQFTYYSRLHLLKEKQLMHTKQYVGEGATFFLVILIGAAVVYSSFRRSIRLSRQQNNFMLSVTHELKSPIAAMKLNLQTLEKRNLDETQKSKLLDRCIKEVDRLNDLCNNMLFTSQIEGRQYKQAREQINFSELVEDCVNSYAHRYPQRFEEDIVADAKLTGDKMMLQMAINNLLENAIKYTPADKPITIKLTQKNNVLHLQVMDQGPGIPHEEKKKIFNKFYRIGNEESRKTKGTGLGLYLACKIVGQHKGRIVIKDNTPTGAIFEVSLPAN
ncbi:MAG TPA: HAMP domain-containing sensor histidine kinase [Flavipsychrobacter sp.]|nr:HAMP domain-containing sensor histidine kinase [Flavipsychrobacter sp.]